MTSLSILGFATGFGPAAMALLLLSAIAGAMLVSWTGRPAPFAPMYLRTQRPAPRRRHDDSA